MLPKLTRSTSAPVHGSQSLLKTKSKSNNPMGLSLDDSVKKSPTPSPKHDNQHIGQLVPSQPVGLQNAKIVNPKRIQVVQLQIKTDDMDIPNSTQNLKEKVKDVFDAFALVHQENMVDNRKGTVPVYTLPEFFWSDFKTTLTEDQKATLIDDIKARAQGDEFEGAVFVLGTMVSSKPPQSMSSLHQQDLVKIQQHLGDLSQLTNDDQINFTETYNQAMDHGIEDCSSDQQEARALLSTVGDMMEAKLAKANIKADTPLADFNNLDFDRDKAMTSILKRVKTMSTHREALSVMATAKKFPNKSKMDQVIQLVSQNKHSQARKLLAGNFKPGIASHNLTDNRLESLAELFKVVGSKQKSLKSVVSDFTEFYYPKSASNTERKKFDQRAGKNGLSSLKDPSSMYKLTQNQAMIVEGGKGGKVDFTQKLLPSHADTPSYFENRESDELVPHKLQSASIIANPKQESEDIGQQISDHNITEDNFIFKSPKTGIDIGVAVCRDYIGGVYKDHFDDGIKDQIDHLQIVAAGVPKIYKDQGSAKTSIGLNDGNSGNSQFVTTQDLPNKGGQDLRTDIVEYDPSTQKFKLYPQSKSFEKHGMSLDDKKFAMGIGKPTHLKDHDPSSVGSFKDNTNVGTVKLMETMIRDHETSISLWQDMIAELTPILKEMDPFVQEIGQINMRLTEDREAKEKFDKENANNDKVYESPLNHEQLNLRLSQLHQELAPWIDQINKDPLLLKGEDQKFGPTEGHTLHGLLKARVEKYTNEISNSTKIVSYNKDALNRITVDRLRAQHSQLV